MTLLWKNQKERSWMKVLLLLLFSAFLSNPMNAQASTPSEPESENFQNDSVLFKMDGPIAHQGSGDVEWYTVEIMILLTDIIQLTNDNAYDIYTWAGVFQGSMLNDALGIYRFGDGVEDDDSLICCLAPDPSVRNNVRVVSYGQIDKDLRIKQVSINGRFVLHC